MTQFRSIITRVLWGGLICGEILGGSCLAKADNNEVCRSFPLDLHSVRTAAEHGDAYCMAVLGVALSRGIGFEPDIIQSQTWKRRSWEAGEPFGLYLKAVFLRKQKSDSDQVKQAFKKARKAIEAAAQSKDPHYELSLGWIIETGADGSKPEPAIACTHYLNAASVGHPGAKHNYAVCWQNGKTGIKDLEQAVTWYDQAASDGYSCSAWALGDIYKWSGNVEKARQYYSQAAKIGHSQDKLKWGRMLENGTVNEADVGAAAIAYKASSEQGSTRATYRLAWLYFTGDGLPEDKDKAKQLFKKAAQGDDFDAINMLKALGIE